jgi:hypothetical protein
MEIEFVYVVSGQFKFKVADHVVSVAVGTFIFVPPDNAHTFKNVGTNPGVLLFDVTPGGFERMFAERQGVDADTNRGLTWKSTTCRWWAHPSRNHVLRLGRSKSHTEAERVDVCQVDDFVSVRPRTGRS